MYAVFLLFPRYAYLGNGYLMGHRSGARKTTKFLDWGLYRGGRAAARWNHVSRCGGGVMCIALGWGEAEGMVCSRPSMAVWLQSSSLLLMTDHCPGWPTVSRQVYLTFGESIGCLTALAQTMATTRCHETMNAPKICPIRPAFRPT